MPHFLYCIYHTRISKYDDIVESMKICSFVKTHLLENTRPYTLTPTSIKWLESIYSKMDVVEREWTSALPLKDPLLPKGELYHKGPLLPKGELYHKGPLLPKGELYNSIPQEIRTFLETTPSITKIYEFPINKRNIRLVMVYPTRKKIDPAFFQDALHKIFVWLSVADQFATQHHHSTTMNLHLYFTDHKKSLPKMGELISPIHANTAFTTYGQETTHMSLYRKEEWFKVFIHETFHSLGLDFINQPSIAQKMRDLFRINVDIQVHESYTETMATILHTLFVVYRPGKPFHAVLLHFQEAGDCERAFSMFQCVKVLDHIGYTYQDWVLQGSPKYHEETNVISYYLIKSVLLFHWNEFMEWCIKNNTTALDFPKRAAGYNSYIGFIRDHYQSPAFLDVMSKMTVWYRKHITHMPDEFKNTLRMTVVESII